MESGTNSKKSSVAERHSVCHPVALEEDKPDVGEHLHTKYHQSCGRKFIGLAKLLILAYERCCPEDPCQSPYNRLTINVQEVGLVDEMLDAGAFKNVQN